MDAARLPKRPIDEVAMEPSRKRPNVEMDNYNYGPQADNYYIESNEDIKAVIAEADHPSAAERPVSVRDPVASTPTPAQTQAIFAIVTEFFKGSGGETEKLTQKLSDPSTTPEEQLAVAMKLFEQLNLTMNPQ